MMVKRIGIAGAGLMGRMLGLACVRAGLQVTLIDRDPLESKTSCGFAGAGMLAPFCEAEKHDLAYFEMAYASLKLWPSWVQSLNRPVFFQQAGSVFVAHVQDRPELERICRGIGAKLGHRWEPQWLTGKAWHQLEPACAPFFERALYLPEEAQVEAWDLMPALQDFLLEKARWIPDSPVLELAPGRIQCAKETYAFDHVVDCRGLGAQVDLNDLRGVRGELLVVQAAEVTLNRPLRLAHPRYPLYVVPRPDHVFLIGATQVESESMEPLTVHSALELLSAAYSVHPGFAQGHILNASVHCRPAFSNNCPKILTQPGLTRINGLYRHGFLFSPLLAEESLRIIEDKRMIFKGLLQDD